MKFLKCDLGVVSKGSIVEVKLSGTEANVLLVNSLNLSSYQRGDSFSYYGGHFTKSPARIAVPSTGSWYIVVDLGGFAGSVSASVKILSDSDRRINTDNRGTTGNGFKSALDEISCESSNNTTVYQRTNSRLALPSSNRDPYSEYKERFDNGEISLSPFNSFTCSIVNSSDIFGMHDLDGQTESEFWTQHNRSKEDYLELASKLPDVQVELANGKTLDAIKTNPELAACVSQYYSPDKMIKVYRYGNSYIFDGDGRHRILAAQTLGYQMPVNITHIVENTAEE
jgi:hypothetical protein